MSLILFTRTMLSTSLILAVCRTRDAYENDLNYSCSIKNFPYFSFPKRIIIEPLNKINACFFLFIQLFTSGITEWRQITTYKEEHRVCYVNVITCSGLICVIIFTCKTRRLFMSLERACKGWNRSKYWFETEISLGSSDHQTYFRF